MKLISLDSILYKFGKVPSKDNFGFIPDKPRKKALKLRAQLEDIKFDLTPYKHGYLRFGELFELTCRNYTADQLTKPEDPLYACYVQVRLKPEEGCTHHLVEMCRRILSVGDKKSKGMECWFPSWQLACTDIYESMVDSLNKFLKHLIALYDRLFEVKGLPDNIGLSSEYCKDTNRHEFRLEIKPKDVKPILEFYASDGWCATTLKEYREYLIECLAKVASKNITPFEPVAFAMPIFVRNAVLNNKKAKEKLENDCKDVIKDITAKANEIMKSNADNKKDKK